MEYLSSFFKGSDSKMGKNKNCDGIFKIMGEEEVQEILCMNVGNLEFSKIVPKKSKDGQTKECWFLNSKLQVVIQEVHDGATKLAIPCLHIENLDYDSNQDQEKEWYLPIA